MEARHFVRPHRKWNVTATDRRKVACGHYSGTASSDDGNAAGIPFYASHADTYNLYVISTFQNFDSLIVFSNYATPASALAVMFKIWSEINISENSIFVS